MQLEAVVTAGRGPVTVHGHGGSPIGWFRRGGFPGDDRKPVRPVEFAGVYYGFGAIPPKWVGQLRGKAVIDRCI